MIRINNSIEAGEAFSKKGFIGQSLPGFEPRPEQIKMASAVQKALISGRHLAVEAGTGVGKSFAYLVPVIDRAAATGLKVLVSTFTITLQEQLINKDLPFLAECMPCQFTAVLAKGRANYLCKRRLDFALRRQRDLYDSYDSDLEVIKDWAENTSDGSLSDLSFVPKNSLWDSVCSEHGNCRGRKCGHFRDCFYWRARRRLETADIIVANHALMFSDLVLKEQGASILPDYRYVIVDEAHNLEHVAENHFGINLSYARVKYLLDGLYSPRSRRGFLGRGQADKAIEIVKQTSEEAKRFFRKVDKWYQSAEQETQGRCHKNFVEDTLSGPLKKLASELSALRKRTSDVDEKFELGRFIDRSKAVAEDIEDFLGQKKSGHVYWVEASSGARVSVRLKSAAVNVGPDVKRCLFEKFDSVVLTSATLSVSADAEKAGFGFFAGRIGLEDFDAVELGSPFDYQKQVTVYIEKYLPNPNAPEFVGAASEAIKKYIEYTSGRAFVLFTSYAMLGDVAENVSDWLSENDIELLQQGAGLDRGALLNRFKSKGSCALFGTDSFWQGVDVPGDALGNVIIVRLPFAVPNQPLLAGRLEQIKEQGGNPFFDYQLPSAIIKFKQGFGRLIRTRTDTGIIVILDNRIVTKAYGREFLKAVPKCRVQIISSGERGLPQGDGPCDSD